MTRFVQIHALTTYPPGNPNRDDLGRPKAVVIGGAKRQRISSQCLKRTWRRSEPFAHLTGGVRTKDVVGSVQAHLEAAGVDEKEALELATRVGKALGSQPVKKNETGSVLTFLTLHEVQGLRAIVEKLKADPGADIDAELEALPSKGKDGKLRGVSPDVALFGRMVATEPTLGIDAALQVAHAFTVHKAGLEIDYWTGVSDEDPWFDAAKSISDAGKGAGMIDTAEFGGGVFYHYACINRDQLVGNLGGDEEAARTTIQALVHAMATTTPGGKKTQFATNARAEYVLVEQGGAQPRSLAGAFQAAMPDAATVAEAAEKLKAHKKALDDGYGDEWNAHEFRVGNGTRFDDLLDGL